MVPHDPVSHDQHAGKGHSLPLEAVHDDIGSVSPKNDVPGCINTVIIWGKWYINKNKSLCEAVLINDF